MIRYQLLIEYVGTNFRGWQIQKKGSTIQGLIQEKISKLLKKKKLQKIFVISGKNSFYKTGAEKLFFKILKNKEHFLYLKKGYLPEFSELINIIKLKDNYKPDLIIAIGGGCAMDLAKISSVFDYGKDLKKRVLNNIFLKIL